MKKIGIYGGTFDPIHKGHVQAALAFLQESELDALYIMPAAIPPHKEISSLVSASNRFRMCELAFEDHAEYGKRIFVSDYEINAGGASFTVLTLRHFEKCADEIEFLCGTDMFLSMDRWYEAAEIFARATIAYVRRECDVELDAVLEEKKREYERLYGARIKCLQKEPIELASSDVRGALASGKNIKELVPENVYSYIKEKSLYGEHKKMITEEMLDVLREKVKGSMSEKRFRHTLGVEREAARLSAIYAPDKMMKMRAAALLHDITKEYCFEKQLKTCEEFGIIIDTLDRLTPKTFHARTAAVLIPDLYPEYDDNDIVSAVRYHTTGRADMGICECILYLADYIEDTRTFPDCVKLREHFYRGLADCKDEADKYALLYDTMVISFDMTMSGLISDGVPICHDTVDARNSFILLKK